MREVQLVWDEPTVSNTEFGKIIETTSWFEVIAHLEVTKQGVRQLVKVKLRENMSIEQLNEISFLDIEGPMNPYPLPEPGEEGYIVAWNNHQLTVSAIGFDSIHVIPPYVINDEGIRITVRGLPHGVSGFLKAARVLMPPDHVKVTDLTELKENLADVLTEKQLEIAVLAVNSGYYNQPREISKKELSEITGIPRSTLQEHLAKAEATLVKHAVQSQLSK